MKNKLLRKVCAVAVATSMALTLTNALPFGLGGLLNVVASAEDYNVTISDENTSTDTTTDDIPTISHTLTKIPAKAATCLTYGSNAYYGCNRCNKYFSDSNGTSEIEEKSWITKPTGHNIEGVSWGIDGDYHIKKCTACQEVVEKSEHIWGEGAETTPATDATEGLKTYTCTACGETRTEAIAKLNHEHTPATEWTSNATQHWHNCTDENCNVKVDTASHTWNNGTETVAATEITEGVKTYKCTICGKEKTETIPVLAHTHSAANSWNSTSTEHWQRCGICGDVINKATHVWGSIRVNVQPTADTTGSGTQTCSVCHETKTVTIPKLTSATDDEDSSSGGSLNSGGGAYIPWLEDENYGADLDYTVVPDKNYTYPTIDNPDDVDITVPHNDTALKSIFGYDSYNKMVGQGFVFDAKFVIRDGNSVSEADKALVRSFLAKGWNVGMYLDIGLFTAMMLDGRLIDYSDVHILNKPVDISLTLPENLAVPGRYFAVVRVHSDRCSMLNAEFDTSTRELSFMTDKFSTYAVVFSDTYKPEDTSKPEDTTKPEDKDNSDSKGDENNDDIPATGVADTAVTTITALCAVALIISKKNRKNG